jgi:hypothetical protein
MMRKLILKIALWLARLAGEDLVRMTHVGEDILKSASMLCDQVDSQDTSGEHKRAQVLRALMNRHPEAKERELAAAIERCMCSE